MKIDKYDVSPFSRSNRIKAIYGQSISFNLVISYNDGGTEDCEPPEAIWLRDGLHIITDSNDEVIGTGQFFSSLDFEFQRGDEGVYQCIFSFNDDTILLGSYATRIDSGELSICDLTYNPLYLLA